MKQLRQIVGYGWHKQSIKLKNRIEISHLSFEGIGGLFSKKQMEEDILEALEAKDITKGAQIQKFKLIVEYFK